MFRLISLQWGDTVWITILKIDDEVLNFTSSPQLAEPVSLWNDGHCTRTFFFRGLCRLFKEHYPLDCWVICSVYCASLSDWVHDVEAAETPAESHFGWRLWRRWTKTFSWAVALISRSFQLLLMSDHHCGRIVESLPWANLKILCTPFDSFANLIFWWNYFTPPQ